MNTPLHIASIIVDESGIAPRGQEVEHERKVAIHDLIEWNHFAIRDATGPFHILLGSSENRITFQVTSETLNPPLLLTIPLAPFRGIIRDYMLICGSYFEAVKQGNMQKIEAIDMSRRGLHNEGADLLATLLADKVDMDYETARRLFTLLHTLHLK